MSAGYILLLNIFPATLTVGTFEELCMRPFFYGKGVLKGLICEVTYDHVTHDDGQALDLCESYSPFEVQKYTKGYPTICTYVKTHQCEDFEYSILDQCIALKHYSNFDPVACGKQYTLYKIHQRDERKWLCVLAKAFEVWIGNTLEEVQFLNPRLPAEYENMDLSRMRLKLQLGSSKLDEIPAGTLFYELPEKHHFHVCSRPARAFEQTLQKLQDGIRNLGLPSGMTKDMSGRLRPFTYIPLMIPVKGENDKTHVQELHEACKALPYGYIASLGEFQNIGQFASLKKRFPSGIYRTTIARMKSTYDDNVYNICNSNKLFEILRKKFTYYGPNNKTLNVPERMWEDKSPLMMCSDMPRLTVAIANKYVDIPAFARRAVICTYGNNPNVPALKNHEQCSRLAHYEKNEQRCLCDNPKFEARTRDPQMYGSYPEGIICLECFHLSSFPAKGGSIVFILEDSQTTTSDGWLLQKTFLEKLLGILPDSLVGIIINNGRSHVEIDMDYFEIIKDRIHHFIRSRGSQQKWSAVGPALYQARLLLMKDSHPSKFIVLFNDGNFDTCPVRDPWCSELARTQIRSHDVKSEAHAAWAARVEIIYILFGTLFDTCDSCKKRVEHIARGYNNVIRVRKITDIDATTVAKVSKKICNKYPARLLLRK